MALYSYKAKNLQGHEESSALEAQDRGHLSKILHQRGYYLISSEEKGGRSKFKFFKLFNLNFLQSFRGVPLAEKLFFTRNLSIMIKTGVPVARALGMLSKQARSGQFRDALNAAAERITKGDNLSSALAHFPKIFSILYRETLKIGEETGKLDESLKMLSLQLEREHSLKSKIVTAMVYPVIVLCLLVGIGIFMLIFAIPKLKIAFTEMNVTLPFTTKIILGLADFIVQRWPLAILTGLALAFSLAMALTLPQLKKGRSWILLRIPLLSNLTRMVNSALMLRTVSSLLNSGVPIISSLEIASGSLSNFYFQKSLLAASKSIEKGENLAEALAPYAKLYFSMVIQMIEVGEETGETPEILKKLAEFYEEEVSNNMTKLSSVIEPLMLIIVGALVGFFAVSMMQPMFSMMEGAK